MPNLQKEEAVALGEGKVDPTLLKRSEHCVGGLPAGTYCFSFSP